MCALKKSISIKKNLYTCQRKSVYNCIPNAKKFPLKFSPKSLIFYWQTQNHVPSKRATILSHFQLIYTLQAHKKTKNKHFFGNFHFCAHNFTCLLKLLYRKKFLFYKCLVQLIRQDFFHPFDFLYSRCVKNNTETYLSKLLKQYRIFWGQKSASLALSVPDVCTSCFGFKY